MPKNLMLPRVPEARRGRSNLDFLSGTGSFIGRHIGPNEQECQEMIDLLGFSSLDELIDKAVPRTIRLSSPLRIGDSRSESDVLSELKRIASNNQMFRSFIGMGYHACFTPPVIQRNILENPGWYTH